jgi:hypothetical protein
MVPARLRLSVVSGIGASVRSGSVGDNEMATDQTEEGGSWQVSHEAELDTSALSGDALKYYIDGSDPCVQATTGDTQLMIVAAVTAGDANVDEVGDALDMIFRAQCLGESRSPGSIRDDVTTDGAISVLDMIIAGQRWTG